MTVDIKNIANRYEQYVQPSVLCKTISGLDCPLLTITRPNGKKEKKVNISINSYKVILLCARIHPSESNSSLVLLGFLKELFTTNCENLLKEFVFKVVPMINIDGVIAGSNLYSYLGY